MVRAKQAAKKAWYMVGLNSKTVWVQIGISAGIMSFPEVQEIYCQDARAPVILAAVATYIARRFKSDLGEKKQADLKLINLRE